MFYHLEKLRITVLTQDISIRERTLVKARLCYRICRGKGGTIAGKQLCCARLHEFIASAGHLLNRHIVIGEGLEAAAAMYGVRAALINATFTNDKLILTAITIIDDT